MTSLSTPISANNEPGNSFYRSGRRLEIGFWAILLLLVNLSLLGNIPAGSLIYDPAAVARGEWWRLLSWPLVHVSRYHLLIDGLAFLQLLHSLEERRGLIRFGYVATAAAGSLVGAQLLSPNLASIGLCGLSGVAHGLFMISALEMLGRQKRAPMQTRIGLALLLGIVAKVAWELTTGQVAFASLHLGSIGIPVVESHFGGLLGGALAYLLVQSSRYIRLAKDHIAT